MSFFSEEIHGIVNVNGGYVRDKCDPEALELLKSTIGLLAQAVGSARIRRELPNPVKDKAFRCVVGFGALGISEGQACLLLFSASLDRSARIHLRSLYEYNVRARLVSNPEIAVNFLAAAAYEVNEIGSAMGYSDEAIASAISRFALPPDAKPGKEGRALGGTMKKIIEQRSGAKEYAGFFAFPSQMSHGSILALHEVANAVAGKGAEFPAYVISDGRSNEGLLQATTHIHDLIATIREVCEVGSIIGPLYDLSKQVHAIRVRLGHVAPTTA